MSLVPSVTELLLAEFLYLQYENNTAPIYMYVNSAGVQVFIAGTLGPVKQPPLLALVGPVLINWV